MHIKYIHTSAALNEIKSTVVSLRAIERIIAGGIAASNSDKKIYMS